MEKCKKYSSQRWGLALVLAIFFSFWSWYFMPWFLSIERLSYFGYMPGYIFSFLEFPGGLVEYVSRFIVQFYHTPWGVVLTNLVLFLLGISVFSLYIRRITASRTKRCPLFFRSWLWGVFAALYFVTLPYQLQGVSIWISVLLGSLLAWVTLCIGHGKGIFPVVFSFLSALALYYFCGPLVVVYLCFIGVARYKFFLGALVGAVLSFWVSKGVAFTLPALESLIPLMPEMRCAFIVLLLLMLSTLLYVPRYGRTRYRRINSHLKNGSFRFQRQSLWMAVETWGLCLLPSAFCLWLSLSPFDRTFYEVENAASKADWSLVYRKASNYFDSHPVPVPVHGFISDKNRSEFEYKYRLKRELLSVNLKLALIKMRRLNSQFLTYSSIPEMNLFMEASRLGGNYHLPHVRFAYGCGLFVPMRIYLNNILNVKGIQNETLLMVVPNSIFLGRYDLASNYLYWMENTLWYKDTAIYWTRYNSEDSSGQQEYISFHRSHNSLKMVEESSELDFWADAMYTPQSGYELLEYKTFLDLFYKRLDSLPSLAEHYRRLGYTVLPDYVQLGLLIHQENQDGHYSTFADYAYSPSIVKEFEGFNQMYYMYRQGLVSLSELQKQYGFSYMFHYYLRDFVYGLSR